MSEPLRLGSMCTGYGGLDQAVSAVLDVEPAWVADPDPGAAAILAHHWPDVPNLGDITTVRWEDAVAVDILATGFPCQDISYAGLGAGIKEGTRSGLWHTIADAVRVLRPRLLVLENVRAIVSRRPGLDVVLGDLARLGFDAEWVCVRASDVGASHQRWRWFLLAWPADADGPRLEGRRVRRAAPERRGAVPDAHGAARGERRQPAPGQAESGRAWADARGRGGAPAADTPGDGRDEGRPEPVAEHGRGGPAVAELDGVQWGDYYAAINRWEGVLGRPAPRPVEPGRTGERLSPAFVEWLMGLPEGHVTDPAIWTALAETRGKRRARFTPTSARNAQLKALGNGVVPQQGAAAIAHLLDRIGAAA